MTAKKKASRRRGRKLNVAAVLGAMVIRCALLDAQAPDAWAVIKVDADAIHGEMVHVGSNEECALWLAQAPSGFHYVLAQLKSVKGVTR